MTNFKFFAVIVSLLVFLVATACYKAPTANVSRSTPTAAPSAAPSAERPASPATSATTSPAQNGGGDYAQALSDYNAKNFDKAERGFKRVLETEPNNAEANYYLGDIYYKRRELNESLGYFEKAAKIDYKSVDKLMALGENQRALEQFDRAIVQYQKVIGFDDSNANAYYGLGLTYIGLNNKIAARQQLRKLEPLNKALAEKLSKEIDGLK